jgi:hypothetical protein
MEQRRKFFHTQKFKKLLNRGFQVTGGLNSAFFTGGIIDVNV